MIANPNYFVTMEELHASRKVDTFVNIVTIFKKIIMKHLYETHKYSKSYMAFQFTL